MKTKLLLMLLMLLLILHKPTWILASAYPLAPSPQVPPFSPFPTSMSASSPGSMKILTFFSDLFFGFSHLFFSETIMFEELSHTKCRYFSQQEFEPDAILTCSLCHTICCFFLMMELVLNSFKFNTST